MNTVHLKLIFTALLVIFMTPLSWGQEQEERISKDDVPASALDYLKTFPFTKKIKWYSETNGTDLSIEAKTKWNGYKYSIEFDTLGQLQDIEVTLNIKDLNLTLRDSIYHYFRNSFASYSLCKTQRQYSGNPELIKTQVLNNTSNESTIIRYEIVAKVQTDKVKQLKEFLFDQNGVLLQTKVIPYRNIDNLEY